MADLAIPADGKLALNIAHFARALRRAGLRIGPARLIEASRAVAAAGFTERMDFYWVLHAVFVSRPEEREIYDQIFRLYWRDPQFLEQMMSFLIPQIKGVQDERQAVAAEKRQPCSLAGRNPSVRSGSDRAQHLRCRPFCGKKVADGTCGLG